MIEVAPVSGQPLFWVQARNVYRKGHKVKTQTCLDPILDSLSLWRYQEVIALTFKRNDLDPLYPAEMAPELIDINVQVAGIEIGIIAPDQLQ